MSYQRRIDLLFAATAHAGVLARGVRRSGSVVALALTAGVIVHSTVGPQRAEWATRLAQEHRPTWDRAAAAQPATPSENAAAGVAPQAAARRSQTDARAKALSQEQQNVARFIAQQYRLTLDRTTEFVDHAYRVAREVKLDPLLVLAVMSVESSFNPRAQSHAGAQGLMQVLTRVHVEKFVPFGGIAAVFDPAVNIRVGSSILKEYLQREGSVEGALKSYVGAAFMEHDGGYGAKVLNARDRIAAAAQGKPIPPAVSFVSARALAQRQARALNERSETSPVAADERPEATAAHTEAPLAAPTALSEPDRQDGPGMAL